MSDEIIRQPLEPAARDGLHRALDAFTLETALLFFRMRVAAKDYLGRGEHSSGHRSLLKSLGAEGPRTVPDMAAARAVSRQHVQKLVDGLKADGLVAAIANPAHRRSVLIALTRRGAAYLREMEEREEALWRFLGRGLSRARVEEATDLMRLLRRRFESEGWERAAGSG